MKTFGWLFIVFLMFSCSSGDTTTDAVTDPVNYDLIYHYSVLKALDNGVLEGTMIVGELKKYGDIGLGTFNGTDGEMIVLNGEVYRVSAEGSIVKPDDAQLVPYTVLSFFRPDDTLQMEGIIDYPSLIEYAEGKLPSQNLFYAIRISGEFEYIKCGGAFKQERPYDKSLPEMLANRPIYEAVNIFGTLVGYWCPKYIGDINSDGFHLHFLSDDHSVGGHLLEFTASSLEIVYDDKSQYKIVLLETDEFKKAVFREEKVDY
ncbi:acetolactate decarboxylase [Bacteroidota bacterium]